MTLLDRIVTPTFVAFNAHTWFAAFVVSQAIARGVPVGIAATGALALAALKEFGIDAHLESGQTFRDNLTDWLGYAVGVGIGAVAS